MENKRNKITIGLFLLLIVTSAVVLTGCLRQSTDQQEVQAVWQEFRSEFIGLFKSPADLTDQSLQEAMDSLSDCTTEHLWDTALESYDEGAVLRLIPEMVLSANLKKITVSDATATGSLSRFTVYFIKTKDGWKINDIR